MNGSARWFLLTALGAAVILPTGSGLVSLLSDSVTVTGNRAESGSLGSHDLQVALGAADCDTASYSDGPVNAAVDASVDLSTTDPFMQIDVCLKNNGSAAGSLGTTFDNVMDIEADICEADEDAVDSTCELHFDGELADVLDVGISASCGSAAPLPLSFVDLVNGVSFFAALDAGDVCEVTIIVRVSEEASETALRAAQSDVLTWDIVFTLEDVAAP